MEPAIYPNLPADEYRKALGINKSFLSAFKRSPKQGQHYLTGEQGEETDPMKMGTLLHRFVLEPEKAAGSFVTRPEQWADWRTKDAKAWRDEQWAAGRTVCDAEERAQLVGMVQSIMSFSDVVDLIDGSQCEASVFAPISGRTDLIGKARIDILPPGNGILDIKTTNDASREAFEKKIVTMDYHMQAAWYIDRCRDAGMNKEVFLFIAVESKPPYECVVYQIDSESIELGRKQYSKLLTQYEYCLQTNDWPGYFPTGEIQTIGLPEWAKKKLNQ